MFEQRPHITVATMVENQGRLLMVKEHADGLLVYNQPAGHLEVGETLVNAAMRETLEETAWLVEVVALLGIYSHKSSLNGITYVRHCFIAKPIEHFPDRELDPAIAAAVWLSPGEIEQRQGELRSPLVLAAVRDFQAGRSHPLSLLIDL